MQDSKQLNLFANEGVARREVIMRPGHGRADYLLYVDKKVVGVIEAKPEGTTLSGVEWQSAMYATGLPSDVRLKAITVADRLPFVFADQIEALETRRIALRQAVFAAAFEGQLTGRRADQEVIEERACAG